MKSITIRPADLARDGTSLCGLASLCGQGDAALRYHVERTTFDERSRLFEESIVLVVEDRGAVVATGTVGLKTVWISGAQHRVAYFFDKMVAPTHRRMGINRRLLHEQFAIAKTHAAALSYAFVHDRNDAAKRALESVGMTPYPHAVQMYTVIAGADVKEGHEVAGDGCLVKCGDFDEKAFAHVDGGLRATYEFVDSTADSCEAFVRAEDSEGLLGVRRRGIVFERVPALWRVAGTLLSWVPRPGVPFRTWSVHNIGTDRGGFSRLIANARSLARREHRCVIDVPLFANDPRIGWVLPHSINRFAIAPTRGRLYVCGPARDALFSSRKPPLVSGRDF